MVKGNHFKYLRYVFFMGKTKKFFPENPTCNRILPVILLEKSYFKSDLLRINVL